MRDRRRERDRLRTLGNLVPVSASEESTSEPIPPLPLRRKRAETMVNYSDEEFDREPLELQESEEKPASQRSSLAKEESVRRKKKSVSYGKVKTQSP